MKDLNELIDSFNALATIVLLWSVATIAWDVFGLANVPRLIDGGAPLFEQVEVESE